MIVAISSEANAMPRLIDRFCTMLVMLEPMLACAGVRSMKPSVFIAEYCSDMTNP